MSTKTKAAIAATAAAAVGAGAYILTKKKEAPKTFYENFMSFFGLNTKDNCSEVKEQLIKIKKELDEYRELNKVSEKHINELLDKIEEFEQYEDLITKMNKIKIS